MNKKALIGTIFLIFIILVVAIGAFTYFQVKKNGIQLSSGDIIIDVKFNDSDKITGNIIDIFNETIDVSNSTNNKSKFVSNISENMIISP